MGTKNNPGRFDCFANAEPDEPMFVLLGRDTTGSLLVRLWAEVQKEMESSAEHKETEKIDEAYACAHLMRKWAVEVKGKVEKSDRASQAFRAVIKRLGRQFSNEDAL